MNAKELLLAKINAVPGLVDVYTYLTTVGVPFREIADFMTSDTISFIKQMSDKDIFDSSTNGYNVEKMLAFYLGGDLPSGIEREVLAVYSSLTPTEVGSIGNQWIKTEDLIRLLESDDAIRKMLKSINDSISGAKLDADTLDNMWDSYANYPDEALDGKRNVTLEPFKLIQLRTAAKFLELCLSRNEFKREHPTELLKAHKLFNIMHAVKELSTFGQHLGINQGLKTNLYDFLKAKDRIADYLDGEYRDKFDLDRFVSDESYRNNIIEWYDSNFKKTFNILEAITLVPHFWEMTKTMYVSSKIAEITSVKTKLLTHLYSEIKENVEERAKAAKNKKADPGSIKLSEKEFKSLEAYVNDVFIAKFLKDSDFEVFIEHDAKFYPDINAKTPIHPYEVRRLKLDRAERVATFKNWMDSYVIPEIIKMYTGNSFVDNLRPLANEMPRTEKEITGWKLPLQMMDIDDSPNTIQLYGEILNGFNEIANQGEGRFGRSIGDLFYVYNMIVNKDSFGQTSFTRLFEDVVQLNNNSMANQFNEYLIELDKKIMNLNEIGITLNEARYRIKRDNPDTKVPYTGNIAELGSDYTLDLPYFYNIPSINILSKPDNTSIIKPAFKYSLDEQSLLVEMIRLLESKSSEENLVKMNIITDDELIEYKELPQFDSIKDAKGFVLNGDIYINISKCAADPTSVFLHELSHVVLASMKFNPETRSKYYEMLAKVKDHPMFNQIAELYPNEVGSDLYEEVFANLLETYLSGKEYLPFDAVDENDTSLVLSGILTNNKDTILKSVSYLLGLTTPITKESKILGKSLEDVIDMFGYNLIDTSIKISKTSILDAQILNTVKQDLHENNKLTTTCDEA